MGRGAVKAVLHSSQSAQISFEIISLVTATSSVGLGHPGALGTSKVLLVG